MLVAKLHCTYQQLPQTSLESDHLLVSSDCEQCTFKPLQLMRHLNSTVNRFFNREGWYGPRHIAWCQNCRDNYIGKADIPLPSVLVTLSCVMILSVLCLYLARSSSGLCRYAVGLRFAFASSSSPLLIRNLPGLMLACALHMLCNQSNNLWQQSRQKVISSVEPCRYSVGLQFAFASSSPLLIRNLPGLIFACALRMLRSQSTSFQTSHEAPYRHLVM